MNIKQLTPSYIKQFSKTLQNAGVKSSVLEIFFDSVTQLIDPYENEVTQNVQSILKECKFESLDEINAFLLEYNNFINSAIGFINSYELIEDNDTFDMSVQNLFERLCFESKHRDCYEILLKNIDKVLVKVIEVYEIDMFSMPDENVKEFFIGYLGESAGFIMSLLSAVSVAMHEGEIDRDNLKMKFSLLSSFIYLLDCMRKDEVELIEENKQFVPRSMQEKMIKVGRNDLCPCGSGKKYKKCCMNKESKEKKNPLEALDLPMATHFPLSENDINDFYALWTRLIDFTSRLFCDMRGKKYKKLYNKNKDGKYSFNDGMLKDNTYLDLRDFLLLNFNRIVDNFIDSSRVSKVNQEILREWKRYRLKSDNFFIYEKVPHGSLVWDVEDNAYYYVYDLYDSLFELSAKETALSMLLLPFKGRIIYDGVIGHSNVGFSQNTKDMFLRDYMVLRKEKSFSIGLPSQSSTTKIYQLKISIKGAKPPIWRRVLVEDDMTYKSIHMIIQDIFDWYGGHLHEFVAANRRYTDLEFNDGFVDDLGEDQSKFTIGEDLREINDKITYIYDFGDYWEHEIKLEDILEKDEDKQYPRCIKGKGRGPLEDIGGIWAYNTIVEAYKKEDKETLDEFYVDDNFNPNEFDLRKINTVLGG